MYSTNDIDMFSYLDFAVTEEVSTTKLNNFAVIPEPSTGAFILLGIILTLFFRVTTWENARVCKVNTTQRAVRGFMVILWPEVDVNSEDV